MSMLLDIHVESTDSIREFVDSLCRDGTDMSIKP